MEAARKIVQLDAGPSQSKKRRRSVIGALVVLVVLAVAGVFILGGGAKSVPIIHDFELATVASGNLTVTSTASGTVVLPQTISVTAPQTGYAEKVFVKEGGTVQVGSLLANLSVPDLQNDLLDYQAQLQVAKIAYDGLVNDWNYTIATAQITLTRAEATVAKDQKDVDLKKELSTLKSSLKSDYETAVDTLTTAQHARDDAQTALANDRAKKDLALAQQKATIDELQIKVDRTKADIEACRIKSPIAGEVLSIASTLQVPQSLITQYTVLIKVADRSQTAIDMEVNETDADGLKVGDKLTVTVGTRTLVATILSIGKIATLSSDGLTATVTVRVKPVDAVTLTPGAAAAATLSLGTKAGALTLPRGPFLTTGAQKYVYVVEGNRARKTAVTFGTLQANSVEVKSGLKAGDTVIVSGYQDFIDQSIVQISTKEGVAK
jgi:HlyD family secretion protein